MAKPYFPRPLAGTLIAGLFFIIGIIGCNGGGGKHGGGDGGGGGGPATIPFGVKQLGTIANDIGWGVATDKDDNIFVTGETSLDLFTTNVGLRDIFLVKFLPNGTQDWAKQLGTTADDIGHTVVTDTPKNIFVTGETQGNLFGTNVGLRDIFLVKFDSGGVLQ